LLEPGARRLPAGSGAFSVPGLGGRPRRRRPVNGSVNIAHSGTSARLCRSPVTRNRPLLSSTGVRWRGRRPVSTATATVAWPRTPRIAEALHIRSAAAARGLRTSARGRRCLVRGPRPGQHVPPAIDALHRQDVTGMAGGERPGTTA
jgi:hypothetical protein